MHSEITKEFGLVVRERRIALKLSQEELAFRAGLHRTYIGMIERGEKNITIENMEKLSAAIELSLSALFHRIERKKDESDISRPRV